MNRFFGSGIMVAALTLATFAVFAQEVEEDLLPAVDTSAVALEAATDEIEPAVPSEALTANVSRNTSGDQVMDSMELSRTEITGNQELPKVLYIVPWQKSDPSDLMGRPVNTLLDEVLAPIDREEFVRQVDYYADLHGEDK